MQIITLYKTVRENGGVTVSPIKPEEGTEYTEAVRLIADEGKAVTKDGISLYSCIDTETAEGWYAVDALEENESYLGTQEVKEVYVGTTKVYG